MSAEAVRASQRSRLLRAMLECVGRQGYAATTVPMVVATARVSRNGFYALFRDKLECFLALCDDLADELLGELGALAGERPWMEALSDGMARYLAWWRDRPAVARAYLLELPAAGAPALEQRARQFSRFEAMFAALGATARREQPGLPPLEPLAPRLLVAGLTEIVAGEVRADRLDGLADLGEPLTALAVGVLAGARPL